MSDLIPIKIADMAVDALNKRIAELEAENSKLKHRCELLREAGDEIWYCYRHREPLSEAMQEWAEARASI